MGIGLSHIKHVKLPVTDPRRSASWYPAFFDLELIAGGRRAGELRGVSLFDRDGGFEIALRQREYCAGPPSLAGFDVLRAELATEELVSAIAERCDRLGIERTEIMSYPGMGRALISRTRTERWSGSSGAIRRAWPASSGWPWTPAPSHSLTGSHR
jgi:hypothetical protein